MKKITAALLSLALLTGFGTMTAAAEDEYHQQGEFWMLDAPKTEEIMAYGAGYDTTTWKVPYLDETPAIDGKVGETEYKPFKDFEEYLTLMAPISGTTEEEFNTFLQNADYFEAAGGFVTPYWGWDGTYLYMAFVVQNLSGFYCNPPTSLYLFTQNCLQVGIGDEFVSGNQYTELGFGVNSETGELITHTWLGTYNTQKDTDYKGHYDADSGVVTYEFRIDLAKTVGVNYGPDETIAAGDSFKLAWLLSVNGEGNRLDANGQVVTGEEWQVGFCHGIGGPYSYKASEYFALVTLGAPGEDTEATETEPVTDKETIPETTPETAPETAPDSETAAETEAVSETLAATEATDTEQNVPSAKGCASLVTVGTATAILAAALLFRKREH